MKKQDNSKKMLFEAMHKVTGMPLREDYSDYLDTHYSADGMDDYHADNATQTKAEVLYDKGLELFNAGDVDGAEKHRQEALRISSSLGWDENELPPYGGSAKQQSGGGLSENDNDLNEWTIINDYNLPSYKSYGNDPEFKEIVESMSLIEGPVDEFGALIGYLHYAKANGISDTSKHAEIVLDVLNYFRKRGGEIPNDPNASGSREY